MATEKPRSKQQKYPKTQGAHDLLTDTAKASKRAGVPMFRQKDGKVPKRTTKKGQSFRMRTKKSAVVPPKRNSMLVIFDDPIGDELRAAVKDIESGKLDRAKKRIQKVLGTRAEANRKFWEMVNPTGQSLDPNTPLGKMMIELQEKQSQFPIYFNMG